MPQKLLSLIMTLCLLPWPQLYAQQIILPVPGQLVGVSSPHNPLLIKGIKVHPDNPFRFDFILDNASEKSAVALAKVDSLKEESTRLIKYFLASLTTPEKDMWVNLSPYEKDRIVPESFGQTEMGRDLLAQDYLLKQVTASLIYPEGDVGKAFWKSVYEESAKKHGGRLLNVPISMFNKVWIVPNKAVVYENAQAGTAYVVESSLKVMLEEDYVALTQNNFGKTKSRHAAGASSQSISTSHHPSPRGVAGDDAIVPMIAQSKQPASETPASKDQKVSEIIRQIVIPVLTQEINEGANFAQLRQVYNALILATWYKKKISAIGGSASGGGGNILSQIYQDQNKIRGTEYKDDLNVKAIYQKYLEAFKKGVYNYIKDEPDPASQKIIPKKYFSGGMLLTPEIKLTRDFNNPQINQAMIVNVNLINATFPYENHSASNFNWNLNEADAMNFIPSLGLSDKDEVLSIGGTAHQYMDQVRWEYLFAGFGHHVKVYQPDRAHYLAWKNRYNNINVLPMQLLKMISLINEDFTLDSVKPNSQSVIILPAVLSDPDIDAVTMMRDALEALKNEKYMVVEWYNSKDSYQEVEFRKTDKVLNVYKKEGYEFEEINRGENAHHQWRVYKVKKPSVNQTKNNSASTMTFDLQDNELSQEEVDFQENVIGKLSLKAHSNILSIGGTSDHKLFNGLKQLRLELLFARLKHRVTVFQPNMNTWLQDILIEPWKSAKENIDFNKQHFGKDSGIAPRSQSVVLMMSVLSSWGITFQKKVQILEEALNTLAEDGSLILGWYNWDEQFKAEEFGRTQEVLDWFRRNGYSFEETTRGESGAHEWRVYHVKKPDAAMKNASQVAVYQNWLKQMDGLVIKGKRNGKRYAFVNTQAAFLHQDEFSINEIDAQGKVISENIGDFTVSFQAGTLRLHGIVLYNNKRDDRGQSIFSQILGTMPNELDIEIEDIANLATLRNMFEAIQDQNLDKEFIRDVEVFATRSRVFTKDDHNSVHIDNRIMTEEEHQGLMQIFYDYDKQASAKPNALKSLNAIAADSLMGQILKKSGINRPIHVAFKRLGESRVMNFHIKAEHTLRDRQVRDFAMKSKRGTTLTRRDFIGVFAAAIAASPLFSTAITRRNPQEQIDVDQLSEQIEYFLAKHFEFNVSFTGQFMADQLNAMAEKEKVFLIFGDHFVSFYDRLRADIHAASLKHMRIFDDPDVRQHIATMVTQMHATKQLPKSPYLNKDLQQFFEGPWLMYMIMDQNRFDADEHVANDLLYQAEKFSPELLHMMRKLLSGDHRAQSMMKFQEEWNAFNEHYLMARNYYVVLNVNKEPNGALYYSSQGYKIVSREMKQIKGEDITVLYVASIVSSDEVVYFTSSMEKSRSILIDTEVGLELVDDILQSRNAKETLKLKVYGVKDNYGQDMLQDAMRQLFKDHTRKQVEQYVLRKALVHELAYQARVLYNVDYRGIDRFDVAKDSWDKLTEHLKRWIDYKAVSYLAQFIKAPDARTELIEMYAYYLTERKGTEYIAARWIVNMMDDAPKNEWTKSRHPDAMKKQFARLMAQDSTILQSKAKALIQEFWSPELLKAIEEDLAMSAVTLPTMLTRRQFNFAGMLSMFVSGVVEANGDLDAQEFLESKKNEIMSVYRFLYLGQFLSIYAPKIHVVFQPGLTVPQILPNQNIVILPLEKYESLHQESFFARLVLDLAFYATLMQNPSNGKVYSVVNYQTAQNERIKALEMLIKYKRIDEIDGSLIASEEISIKRALHRIIFNNLGILNKEDQLKAFEVEGITFEQEKQMRVLLRNREYGKTVHVIYDMERDTIKVESKAVDSAQMSRAQIEQGNNRAQYGGIDFNSDTMDLSIKDNGERMAFNVDANLIKRYQNAEGFFPIVTGMVHIPQGPLGVQQLRDFLGVTQN